MNEKDLLNVRLSDETPEEIPLDEIDLGVIEVVREMKKKNNRDYRRLKNAIEKDGQQQPIIIRTLTEDEKSKLSKGKAKKIESVNNFV